MTPRPTAVFDTYWRFAAERQEIFFRRLSGRHPPWTDDGVLERHRFTNVYRAADRVSQYLIRHVLYMGDQSSREVVFRALLFKLFNKIETWELILQEVGTPASPSFDTGRFDRLLTKARMRGDRLYSAAYIMPNPGYGEASKHANHLRLIGAMLADGLPERLARADSLGHAFEMLRAYPSLGDFLAYQLVIDLNYSEVLNFSEMDFVVPGPGAREGLRKCFENWHQLDGADVIRWVAQTQDDQLARRGLALRSLWGRRLQLVDCQNLFCEVAKYARVVHPEVTPMGGRFRIKQTFRASGELLEPWFPPKWGINERVAVSTLPEQFVGTPQVSVFLPGSMVRQFATGCREVG